MKFSKIIKIEDHPTCEAVLVSIERDVENEDYIKISAWHEKENIFLYQEEILLIRNISIGLSFISDYSRESAYDFAEQFEF